MKDESVTSSRADHNVVPTMCLLLKQALGVGLVVTLVGLALSACRAGGQEEGSKALPLPEDPKALHPGKYHSEEFKPSFSFRVGKGWKKRTTGDL